MSDSEDGFPDVLFHHPTWSEPWSHPELSLPQDERKARWKTQPWYEQHGRLSSMFIRDSYNLSWPWGYVIYRTVYTPESDANWARAMEIFDRQIHDEIEANSLQDREEVGGDAYPERLIHESYRNVVLSDKDRFDGASMKQIREYFTESEVPDAFAGGQIIGAMLSRYNACLVIDEKALSSIVDSAASGEESDDQDAQGYCILVDPFYDGDTSEDEYGGFMRVELGNLWGLYIDLANITLDEICPSTLPGHIPLYDGDVGKAVNEDGEIIKEF